MLDLGRIAGFLPSFGITNKSERPATVHTGESDTAAGPGQSWDGSRVELIIAHEMYCVDR